MISIHVATELEQPDGTARRLSESVQELQEGDTVVARIRIGQDETGKPCVQVEMLVNRRAEDAAPRKADA